MYIRDSHRIFSYGDMTKINNNIASFEDFILCYCANQFCKCRHELLHTYHIPGLFSGLKFSLFKFSLELILVAYKIFVNIYLTLIKFSRINFSGFEPTRKLIPHEINQLYGNC